MPYLKFGKAFFMPVEYNFNYRPEGYFSATATSAAVAHLHFPESRWGEDLIIFAELIDGKIFYEVSDFYGNEYRLKPSSSHGTLSLEEIIFMIESLELKDHNKEDYYQNRNQGIPQVKSEFYPQLKIFFKEKSLRF